ncbi:MAG: hypothetical protein QXS37_05555, partial [Candidatus Aenigmatarchaeota archaeon]
MRNYYTDFKKVCLKIEDISAQASSGGFNLNIVFSAWIEDAYTLGKNIGAWVYSYVFERDYNRVFISPNELYSGCQVRIKLNGNIVGEYSFSGGYAPFYKIENIKKGDNITLEIKGGRNPDWINARFSVYEVEDITSLIEGYNILADGYGCRQSYTATIGRYDYLGSITVNIDRTPRKFTKTTAPCDIIYRIYFDAILCGNDYIVIERKAPKNQFLVIWKGISAGIGYKVYEFLRYTSGEFNSRKQPMKKLPPGIGSGASFIYIEDWGSGTYTFGGNDANFGYVPYGYNVERYEKYYYLRDPSCIPLPNYIACGSEILDESSSYYCSANLKYKSYNATSCPKYCEDQSCSKNCIIDCNNCKTDQITEYCGDSYDTDIGDNPNEKGSSIVKYCSGGECKEKTYEDYCYGICNREILREYFVSSKSDIDAKYKDYTNLFSSGRYCKDGKIYLDNLIPSGYINPDNLEWSNISQISIDINCNDNDQSGCYKYKYTLKNYAKGATNVYESNFNNRCPIESSKIYISCQNNDVCIYRLEPYEIIDNTNKKYTNNSNYYCLDRVAPKFVSISHSPEFIASKDNTFNPYPNTYIDFNGNPKQLTPDKIVIDKEKVTIEVTAEDKDPYGYERSGIKSISINFLNTNSIKSDFQSSCPNGATYTTPASHSHTFSNPTIGWNSISSSITDFAGNSVSNSNYKFYVFLGALGNQNNQTNNDKLVFLKTYWDSSSEVKQITSNLGGNSSSKINCYGYNSKCTLIRDIIGKTDEFTDCLWVGPSNNHRNVKIYNFKEIVDLEKNEIATADHSKYEENNNKVVYAWVNPKAEDLKKIAICSKNDTGILV